MPGVCVQLLAEADDQRDATWRERALNAEDALKAAHAEITAQRARIGGLLGQVRDLEAEWTKDAITRITTENTTLKQRVRQLTAENRTLEERLQAARSNNRFADRLIAQLEAKITSPQESRLWPNWPRKAPPNSPRCSSSSATGWNRDHDALAASLARFVGAPGYGPASLREDFTRFAFLLGATDGKGLFTPEGR